LFTSVTEKTPLALHNGDIEHTLGRYMLGSIDQVEAGHTNLVLGGACGSTRQYLVKAAVRELIVVTIK
jgi:hypothetical protein